MSTSRRRITEDLIDATRRPLSFESAYRIVMTRFGRQVKGTTGQERDLAKDPVTVLAAVKHLALHELLPTAEELGDRGREVLKHVLRMPQEQRETFAYETIKL